MYDLLWNLFYNMKGMDVPFRTAADKIPSKRLMFISLSASLNIGLPQNFCRGFGEKGSTTCEIISERYDKISTKIVV
jgi:hypothetical protein